MVCFGILKIRIICRRGSKLLDHGEVDCFCFCSHLLSGRTFFLISTTWAHLTFNGTTLHKTIIELHQTSKKAILKLLISSRVLHASQSQPKIEIFWQVSTMCFLVPRQPIQDGLILPKLFLQSHIFKYFQSFRWFDNLRTVGELRSL